MTAPALTLTALLLISWCALSLLVGIKIGAAIARADRTG